jgi:predicted HTH domain antitoxin
MSDADFAREAQLLLAVKLFELGKLTSGKAAELAGMPRVAFLHALARYNVAAINLQAEEVEYEIEAAKRLTPSHRCGGA